MFRNDRPVPRQSADCRRDDGRRQLVVGGDEDVGKSEDQFIKRDVDLLTCAALRIAMVERHHHRKRAHDGRLIVRHRGAGPQRRPVGLAGDIQQSRKCQPDPVIGGARGVGPGLPIAGDAQHHEPRIDLFQRREADAPFVERAGTKVFNQHIGLRRKVAKNALPLGHPQVERGRFLVAALDLPPSPSPSTIGPF